ncbi:DUF4286 family protein [Actinomadura sp. NEAU-AAG7]|uniref:DUF4286 family protein n=1 Tax=Actinomadura sp. NEAU-AAG7 TaxID=2839640 RepID=UPI001BE49742|nr:DUF4286 family protein [Actinomadura sp. NEAU-AAG7]MBT2212881.1 hypothetical protein [Actinomadura sp. NEAU-AAG7]
MTATPFSSEFLYWVALDFGGSAPADVERFDRFFDETHIPEVLARYPGFAAAHRYALHRPDPRGDFGGGYLAAYEVEDERAVNAYLADESRRPRYSADPPLWPDLLTYRWRVVYEKIAETSPSTGTPDLIYIIGIDPPAGIGDGELAEFDAFYTDTHMPEAVANAGFSRGTRYKVRRELAHPAPGCPRFLVVYELAGDTDELVAETQRKLGREGPWWTPGPASWTGHTTPWRLWYRHISFLPRPTSPSKATIRRS